MKCHRCESLKQYKDSNKKEYDYNKYSNCDKEVELEFEDILKKELEKLETK